MFQQDYVGAVVMPGGASQSRKQLDAWQEWAKQRGAPGLAYVLVQEDGSLGGGVAKFLNETEAAGLAAHVGAAPGDCIFFGAGAGQVVPGAARRRAPRDRTPLRAHRTRLVGVPLGPRRARCSSRPARRSPPVTSRWGRARGRRCTTRSRRPRRSSSTPSTRSRGPALAYAYDMVCNGNEIGGGSIRIHRRDVQERVFAVMGLSEADAQEKFGFLLDAFQFGAPPHGGIAFGWDRICALLSGSDSIREVIAFPKSGGGYDPLTGAPAPITAQQRKEAGRRRDAGVTVRRAVPTRCSPHVSGRRPPWCRRCARVRPSTTPHVGTCGGRCPICRLRTPHVRSCWRAAVGLRSWVGLRRVGQAG